MSLQDKLKVLEKQFSQIDEQLEQPGLTPDDMIAFEVGERKGWGRI